MHRWAFLYTFNRDVKLLALNGSFQALIMAASTKHCINTANTYSYKAQVDAFTFLYELFDVWVKSHPVAFTPQPHVGWIVASAALIHRAHREQLTPVSMQEQSVFPSVQARSAGSQWKAVVGDVNETRIAPAVRESSATVLVSPRVRFVPVIRWDRDCQETQGDERQTETRVQKPLPRRHRSARPPISTSWWTAPSTEAADQSSLSIFFRVKKAKCWGCCKHALLNERDTSIITEIL